jgi:hypothetical protein
MYINIYHQGGAPQLEPKGERGDENGNHLLVICNHLYINTYITYVFICNIFIKGRGEMKMVITYQSYVFIDKSKYICTYVFIYIPKCIGTYVFICNTFICICKYI